MYLHNPLQNISKIVSHNHAHIYSPPSLTLTALRPHPPPPLRRSPTPTPINLNRINKPKRIPKNPRIIPHIRLTRIRQLATTRSSPHPRIPCPLSTKRRIENNLHVLKMRIDIAIPGAAAKVRHRGAPFGGVGGPGVDVGGDFGAGPEPDGDGLAGPFGSIDAAADGIEARAIGRRIRANISAPGILLLPRGIAVAVCGVGSGEGALVPNGAAGVGVEGHLIGGGSVDALDDVDFAGLGPCALAEEPEGGPGAAADGHVGDVGDEEAFVEGFVGGDSDAAAAGGALGCVVDAEVACVAVVGDPADQAGVFGGVVVVELDEAVGGVGLGEGGEVAEEGVVLVVVGEDIACYAALEEEGSCEEACKGGGVHLDA